MAETSLSTHTRSHTYASFAFAQTHTHTRIRVSHDGTDLCHFIAFVTRNYLLLFLRIAEKTDIIQFKTRFVLF